MKKARVRLLSVSRPRRKLAMVRPPHACSSSPLRPPTTHLSSRCLLPSIKKNWVRQPPVPHLRCAAAPLLEIPPTAAAVAHCPRLWTAPATPVVALQTTIHPSGMGCRLSATTGSGSQQLSAYGGLLLDVRGTLLQVSWPVVETYTSIDRRYGSDETTFLALAAPFSGISSNAWRLAL
jgi:hypothetical protein